MSQYEVLNKETHNDLYVRTGYGADLGDAVMYATTFAMEFRDVQGSYPILFTKDPNTGGFLAAALFGFEAEQNLFLRDDRWDAHYVPAAIQRQPFLIATGDDEGKQNPVASLDRSHPRVSTDDGELLFDDSGNPSDFLNERIAILDKLHRGLQHNNGFIAALLENELLEGVTLDMTFANGDTKSLQGFYCIAEEKMYQLRGEVLESLNQSGYLQPAFMAIASLSRVRELIERRNQLHL